MSILLLPLHLVDIRNYQNLAPEVLVQFFDRLSNQQFFSYNLRQVRCQLSAIKTLIFKIISDNLDTVQTKNVHTRRVALFVITKS